MHGKRRDRPILAAVNRFEYTDAVAGIWAATARDPAGAGVPCKNIAKVFFFSPQFLPLPIRSAIVGMKHNLDGASRFKQTGDGPTIQAVRKMDGSDLSSPSEVFLQRPMHTVRCAEYLGLKGGRRRPCRPPILSWP
jgi:hypothetical protein